MKNIVPWRKIIRATGIIMGENKKSKGRKNPLPLFFLSYYDISKINKAVIINYVHYLNHPIVLIKN